MFEYCFEETREEWREREEQRRRRRERRRRECRNRPFPLSLLCEVVTIVVSWIEWVVIAFLAVISWITCVLCEIGFILTGHRIISYDTNGGVYDDSGTPQPVRSRTSHQTVAFNNALVDSRFHYLDSGKRVHFILNVQNGSVEYDDPVMNTYMELKHDPTECDDDSPLRQHEGPASISYSDDRKGVVSASSNFPQFDMIAAGANRVFAKEKDKPNFFFTTLVDEFLHGGQIATIEPMGQNYWVPGFYFKLDPQHNQENVSSLRWWSKDDYDHPSLDAYKFVPLGKHGLEIGLIVGLLIGAISLIVFPVGAALVLALIGGLGAAYLTGTIQDYMMVKVQPGSWHLLDTRPPFGSGLPPTWIETYDHVTYGGKYLGLCESRSYRSITIFEVLDIAIGNMHRHLQYEEGVGGEMDTMVTEIYDIFNGPVDDAGGFCDGTCNFYVFCKIRVDSNGDGHHEKESYAILWIDEQSYFSERWRLLHPDDNKWALLRDWALVGGNTGIKSLVWNSIKHKFDRQKYWCPFETTWFSSKECIDSESQMAVAKQVVLVTGKDPENGDPVLYSINFSWGTADKTWRWRKYPCKVKDPAYDKGPFEEEACYPKTIRIRDDMTICMLGVGRIFQETEDVSEELLVRGYWYQKYLPADNVEVPAVGTLSDTRDAEGRIIPNGKPEEPYPHEWQFISESNFSAADRFSHLGVYQTVDSRSQYYKIDLQGNSALPGYYNRVVWKDHNSRLWVLTGKPPFVHSPPSLFNKATYLKLANRENVGLIAMHWDKRDDELPGFGNVFRTITLRTLNYVTNVNEPNVRIEATLSKRIKDLTAPVVQVAKVIVDHQSEMVTIYFLTRVVDPSPDLPPEPESQYDNSFLDPDISEWCGSRGIAYPIFENEEGFAPDTSIWKINIGALDELEANGVIVFYQGIVSAEFTRKSRYVYCCEFVPQAEDFPRFIKYCGEIGAAKYGTSIWFEDIVGHVKTAERTLFTTARD